MKYLLGAGVALAAVIVGIITAVVFGEDDRTAETDWSARRRAIANDEWRPRGPAEQRFHDQRIAAGR